MEWIILILAGIAYVLYKAYEANEKAKAYTTAINNEKTYQLTSLMYEILSDFNSQYRYFNIPNLESFVQNTSSNIGFGRPSSYTFRAPLRYGVLSTDISKSNLKNHLQLLIDSEINSFPLLCNGYPRYSVYLAKIVVASNEVVLKVFINDNQQVKQMIQNDLKQQTKRNRS